MQFVRTDEITGLWSYLQSIDWSEPWFLGLGAFHLTCMSVTYFTRRNTTLQCVAFAFFLVMVACSEYINEFASNHWRSFARQQYFDSSGLFISVVLSMPLLVNCLVIIVMWLKLSADLAGAIRRKQLRQQARQQGQTSQDSSSRGQTTSDGHGAVSEDKKSK
ncbi:hypothetical protein BaRGS_00038693 [Batillaria attramentaria]|uniref:Transmembrane protein 18 n=1 Tax=Batillaria attramentaria TaxID=370345 RepID=A0ABD0J6G3_9CAEN